MYLCRCMKRAQIKYCQWFFILLFTAYVSGISLFTHTHVINNTTYVHSHPFRKGEKKQHTHTEKQLFILDHFYKTTVTSDIIPQINLSDLSLPKVTPYTDYYETTHIIKPLTNLLLRGPPATI